MSVESYRKTCGKNASFIATVKLCIMTSCQENSAALKPVAAAVVVIFSKIRPLDLFRIYWTVRRTPWTGDRPDARPLPTHRSTQHRKMRTHIHASSEIRAHGPSFRAAEDSACLRPLGCWDRHQQQNNNNNNNRVKVVSLL
jgi:hypothetical protein